MSSDATPSPQGETPSAARLPLFYRRPVPLSSVDHADWKLKLADYSFAAGTAFVPLVLAEIASAARTYPVVFASEGAAPLALTGLEKTNLFVTDGVCEAQPVIAEVYASKSCGLLFDRNATLGGNFGNDLTAGVVEGLDRRISTISFDRERLPQTAAQ